MTLSGISQIVIYFLIVLALTKPVGVFMYRVFEGQRTFCQPGLRPVERLIYWLGRVQENVEQSWVRYTASLISLSTFCVLFPYAIQRLQGLLPLNPMHFSTGQAPMNATPMTPDLAFNTAVSFMTNTNWQSYSPDTTVSYLVQMAALAVQNFVSAAVGIAVAVAMIRGFARHTAKTIGNFWVDVTRCTVYILLPISIVAALFFVWQGSIQNFKGPATVQTLEGTPQTIEQGPLASQLAIKMLGTNGGGFFNANSSHPYENATPLSNLVQMLLIFVLGAGLTYQFGKMIRDTRQGWALFATMSVLFLAGAFICYWAEQRGNPTTAKLGIETAHNGAQPGVKMAIIAILANSMCILGFTAVSSIAPFAKDGYWNPPGPAMANTNNGGPHGFSEIMYAYTSGAGNNGSAFAGINANTPWYNLTLGIDMLIARFLFIIPALAIAGSLAAKKLIPVTSGTLPTHGSLFVILLVGTIVIVGALTYFPALSLGPIVEHFQMLNGKVF